MSNLSTYPTPFQVVLKPGLYQSHNTKGGLNLNKWLLKFLKKIGFAVTTDCCTYYPSFPLIPVVDPSNIQPSEIADVPVFGFFIGYNSDGSEDYIIAMKATTSGDYSELGTYN